MEEDNNFFGAIELIVIFSFISIILVFVALLIVGFINNYALQKLVSLSGEFVSNGFMDSFFYDIIVNTVDNYAQIINYLDYIWFGAFISMVASTFVFSYFRKRQSYFSMFTMITLGIIIITYIGGIIIQVTNWFNAEILLKVFPDFNNLMPIFAWYLSNMAIINLILIAINILLNFIDLDLIKFNTRKKDDGGFNEI